ncbi:hypothetical protein [Polaribacter sargassicola]|uniref:hypothetical protein n=1 Tax=Polaribacter sargassicola TaxID=2836891 RepID=UPI001F26A8D7|nr:hypothetical protein [Polaribacter sp. DS7-9]MCG1035366.1 hypothetical protein [Polaribacter sp. DS7-9]
MLKKGFRALLCLVFWVSIYNLNAQNNEGNWNIGIGVSLEYFGEFNENNKLSERYNSQFSSFLLSRKVGNNFVADLVYTTELANPLGSHNVFEYSAFDISLKYNLYKDILNVFPYIGIGYGYVKGADSVENTQDVISLNFLAGGTYWLSNRVGLTSRLVYKNIGSKYDSMDSHLQGMLGLVYSFNLSSALKSGEKRRRNWN